MEALIKSGAFDSTGAMRKALMIVLEDAMHHGAKQAADRKSGQMGLFGADSAAPQPAPKIPAVEWSESEMLAHEKAVLGFYVTRHPLSMHEEMLNKYATASTADLKRFGEGSEVVLGGMISKIRTVITKNGRNAGAKMGIVTCEDLKGSVEVVVFPRDLDRFQSLLALETLVFFKGQVDRKREEPSLRVSEVIPLESADEALSALVLLRVHGAATSESTLKQVKALMAQHRGDKPVYLELYTANQLKVTLRVGQAGIRPSADFTRAAEDLLGPGNVVTVGSVRRAVPVQQQSAVSNQQSASPAEEHDDDSSVHDEEALVAG
jgi:DNA polymerase-3 subunit alpha